MKIDKLLKYAAPVVLAVLSSDIASWATQAANWQAWPQHPSMPWLLASLLALPLLWWVWIKLAGYTVHHLGSKVAFLFAATPIFIFAWSVSKSLCYCILCESGACGFVGFQLWLYLLVGAPLLLSLLSVGFVKKTPLTLTISFLVLVIPIQILFYAFAYLSPATARLMGSWPSLVLVVPPAALAVYGVALASYDARAATKYKLPVLASLPAISVVVGVIFTALAYVLWGNLLGSTCNRTILVLDEVFNFGPILIALGLIWRALR